MHFIVMFEVYCCLANKKLQKRQHLSFIVFMLVNFFCKLSEIKALKTFSFEMPLYFSKI